MESSHSVNGLDRVKARWRDARPWQRWLAVSGAILVLLLLLIASFPVGLARPWVERSLSDRIGAPVSIGALRREQLFSFSPRVALRDVRIGQPAWAGQGELMRAGRIDATVSLLSALMGRGLSPRSLHVSDVSLRLIRDASGRANWTRGGKSDSTGRGLSDVRISNARFTLRDGKRFLTLSGTVAADEKGLKVAAGGTFHDSPARLEATGPAIDVRGRRESYPFTLAMRSSLLTLDARGTMAGALNTREMTLDVHARAPSLEYLDDVIEAGLFGTQPIDLTARARHLGRDWSIQRIGGRIGRSQFSGRAEVKKVDERTKIDADIRFSQLDFNDIADDKGLATQAALRARIGPRVLPNTRVNLTKVGPTDGTIRFEADRLLFNSPSVFRSLRGTITLQGKLLTIENVQAGLVNGRMTGGMTVDHRTGTSPLVSLDLQFRDGRLGALLGTPDKIDAPFGAHLVLAGRGDTIRSALAKADGRVGLVAGQGHVARIVASVLAQDMGKTIGAALGDGDARVPLRCIAIGFQAKGGVLTAAPFLIETAVSRSRGEGTITLDGERIALVVGGQARDPSGLSIVDPIGIGGTLSSPTLSLAGLGGEKAGVGSILGAVAKSIGGALGLTEKQGPQVAAQGPVDCAAISQSVLKAGQP